MDWPRKWMALKWVTDVQPMLHMCCISEEEGMGICNEACGVSLGETAPGADLGGSSKYSNGNFED